MAGFVDGEGYLTIMKQVRQDRPSPTYRPYIAISNTKRESLELFLNEYGGRIYLRPEKRTDRQGVKWSDAFDWYCPISSSQRLLGDIIPYLKLKHRQAELILEFISNRNEFARGRRKQRGGSSPLTPESISYRESMRRAVRLLNEKGRYSRNARRDDICTQNS
jgi:hypothetical protein